MSKHFIFLLIIIMSGVWHCQFAGIDNDASAMHNVNTSIAALERNVFDDNTPVIADKNKKLNNIDRKGTFLPGMQFHKTKPPQKPDGLIIVCFE